LPHLVEAVPYTVHGSDDNGEHFTDPTVDGWTPADDQGSARRRFASQLMVLGHPLHDRYQIIMDSLDVALKQGASRFCVSDAAQVYQFAMFQLGTLPSGFSG
jgi:hypothetical protein